ncbi:hypothetical protein [Tateyamaria sp.]|uniref:hypothetical protein n=1 Tax=Tateyamaria sp. TaxID=1929288 RepID=UPI0032886C9D
MMANLSEKLADLAVIVGDIEARAEAFGREQKSRRKEKIADLRKTAKSARDQAIGAAQSKQDQVSIAWSELHKSMVEREQKVRHQIEETKRSTDRSRAEDLANRLEANAEHALGLARVSIEEAELAIAMAVDARTQAEEGAAKD